MVVTLYVAAYLACCAVLLYRYPSLWMLLAVLSGSSLFAIERGNNDLVIFVLLFAAISLDSAWLGAALLLLATYLKLFPAFAALFLLRSRAVFWSFLAAAGLYLVVDHTEIAKVTGAVPVSADFAFGIPSLRWWLWLFFRNHPSTSVLVGFFLGCIAIG
jgi:hypothetical protein